MEENYQKNQNQNNAPLVASRGNGASKRACLCMRADASVSKHESSRTDILSRIMESLKEERKLQVRLLKRHKIKFRKNSLWDKKQRNGKVICIEPKNYQKLG
jgi:hypothetical protein